MRISDWSSDVCSSDLPNRLAASRQPRRGQPRKLPITPGMKCRTSSIPAAFPTKESGSTLLPQPIPSPLGFSVTNRTTMTNATIESIVSRYTTKYYDPAATLSDDQIRELVRIGTTAPTSFHLQNWRFIAVRSPEAKARLRPIAWDQPATTEAAVTFIVCGQLVDTSVIPERLAPLVEAGIMPAKMVPEWEIPPRDLYMEYPQRRRDEAVRPATFGAAAMIYAARWMGLGSTPMIGFDDAAERREFGLAGDAEIGSAP